MLKENKMETMTEHVIDAMILIVAQDIDTESTPDFEQIMMVTAIEKIESDPGSWKRKVCDKLRKIDIMTIYSFMFNSRWINHVLTKKCERRMKETNIWMDLRCDRINDCV